MNEPELKQTIKEKYSNAATRAQTVATGGYCVKSDCCQSKVANWDPITSDLYDEREKAGLPPEALLASLGCGNPTALAELRHGEVVLDLGCGGGIDVLLSARRVGPTGKVYGLDMTDQMLELANENKLRAGLENVEFRKGDIEQIPLPDASVDVIISNCAINLSYDKRAVLAEAFRVLKPGGRFAVSDIVVRGHVPATVRNSVELWIGCLAGALEEQEFIRLLRETGFADASIEPTRIYKAEDAVALLAGADLSAIQLASQIDGKFMGTFVRAVKPLAQCCGPDCC